MKALHGVCRATGSRSATPIRSATPELVRLRAGVDLRVSADVAIAPVVALDATMLVFREEQRVSTVDDPKLSTFVFAGLRGRIASAAFA